MRLCEICGKDDWPFIMFTGEGFKQVCSECAKKHGGLFEMQIKEGLGVRSSNGD